MKKLIGNCFEHPGWFVTRFYFRDFIFHSEMWCDIELKFGTHTHIKISSLYLEKIYELLRHLWVTWWIFSQIEKSKFMKFLIKRTHFFLNSKMESDIELKFSIRMKLPWLQRTKISQSISTLVSNRVIFFSIVKNWN